MTIREKGYHSWTGELNTTGILWMPMFRYGIRTVAKKKFSKGLYALMMVPFIIFMIALWAAANPELRAFRGIARWLQWGDDAFFHTFFTNHNIVFLFIMMAVFAGAELISNDIRTNSFPLYFARPLERRDYIFGKYAIVLFYLLLFSVVPGVMLYIFKFIFTGKLVIQFHVLLGLLLVPVISSVFIASITLMISSMTGNARHVKIFIFMAYMFSAGLAQTTVELFGNSHFYMLSMHHNIMQMASFIFGLKPAFRFPAWYSVVIVVGISLLAYRVIIKRIMKAEAQIDSSN